MRDWGTRGTGTVAVFAASIGIPAAAMIAVWMAIRARRQGASRWLTSYAFVVVAAMAWISVYLGAYGLLGLRLWSY